jgi:hypothetical protein
MRKRIIASIVAIIVLGTAFTFPGGTTCALLEFSGLETVRNETRLQASSTNSERQAILELETLERVDIDIFRDCSRRFRTRDLETRPKRQFDTV